MQILDGFDEDFRSVVCLLRGMLSLLLLPGLRKQFHATRADGRLGKN